MNKLTIKQEETRAAQVLKSIELTNDICTRIADGESLRSICREDGYPAIGSFLRWVAEDDILREQYARAMEMRADCLFEEMTDIADDATNDFMDKVGQDGSLGDKVLNAEHIQRSRLRIETRKWVTGRMNPKKYGESSKVTLSGDKDNPIIVKSARDLTDDDLANIAAGSGARVAE